MTLEEEFNKVKACAYTKKVIHYVQSYRQIRIPDALKRQEVAENDTGSDYGDFIWKEAGLYPGLCC